MHLSSVNSNPKLNVSCLVVVAFVETVKVYRSGKAMAFDIDSSDLNRVQNVYSSQSNCLILICENIGLLICMDIFDVIL